MQPPHRNHLIATLAVSIFTACEANAGADHGLSSPVQVALTPYIGQLVSVEAVIGADTAHLIFDTAGGETVISPNIAERIGCTPSGRSVGHRMNGERVDLTYCPSVTLSIAGVDFDHDRIGVWDVQALLPVGVPPIDGVLSLKTFARRRFTLRLAERKLTLETPDSFRAQLEGMSRLRSRIATGSDGDELTVFVRGAVGDTAWFLMDSGNLDVVQAGPHLQTLGLSSASETWDAELALDGLPGVPTTFRTRDIIYDGVLSESFLRQWIFAFDLSTNRVWAARVE
jgi:hypothetical protein